MTERVTRGYYFQDCRFNAPLLLLEPSGIERGRGTAGTTVLPPLSFIENDTAQNNAKIY